MPLIDRASSNPTKKTKPEQSSTASLCTSRQMLLWGQTTILNKTQHGERGGTLGIAGVPLACVQYNRCCGATICHGRDKWDTRLTFSADTVLNRPETTKYVIRDSVMWLKSISAAQRHVGLTWNEQESRDGGSKWKSWSRRPHESKPSRRSNIGKTKRSQMNSSEGGAAREPLRSAAPLQLWFKACCSYSHKHSGLGRAACFIGWVPLFFAYRSLQEAGAA